MDALGGAVTANPMLMQQFAQQRGRPMPVSSTTYPFVNDLNMLRIDTPESGRGFAETWPIGETGTPESPRPNRLPLNQHGIQVFQPDKWSEHDTAGEALHIDPLANQVRGQFAALLTPQQKAILQQQPDYNFPGKETPDQRMQNATDAVMRGYLVGQWPAQAIQQVGLSAQQKAMLDSLKAHMTKVAK